MTRLFARPCQACPPLKCLFSYGQDHTLNHASDPANEKILVVEGYDGIVVSITRVRVAVIAAVATVTTTGLQAWNRDGLVVYCPDPLYEGAMVVTQGETLTQQLRVVVSLFDMMPVLWAVPTRSAQLFRETTGSALRSADLVAHCAFARPGKDREV